MFAAFLYLLLSAASAGTFTYPVVFPIPQVAPAASFPANKEIVWAATYGSNDGLPDMVIQSSWAPLKCQVKNGIGSIVFTATRATWPTSWPTTATCALTFGSDSSTLTVNITISACSGPECSRDDFDGVLQPCPTTGSWTFNGRGMWAHMCSLPTPAAGKIYVLPEEATGTRNEWSARFKLGASPNPDTDAKFAGVRCNMLVNDTPNPDVYTLGVVISDSIPSDVTVYCPIRQQTTSTKVYSWTTAPISVFVNRP